MYDLFILAAGDQNIEIKKHQRCFSPDVCHSHYRIGTLVDLWVYTQGFTINSGEYY
jgi:predicted transcriptional regulator